MRRNCGIRPDSRLAARRRHLVAAVLFSALPCFAQDYLPWSDGFETWLGAKWTISGSAVTRTTTACSGTYAALIDNNDWMYLTLDLSPYSASSDVQLAFRYRNSATWESGDYFYVEINNGAGWQQIHSESNDQSACMQISLDLDAAGPVVNGYQIRFRVASNNANEDAYIDEVFVTGTLPIKVWSGGGNNGRWSTAANWSGNSAPTSGDSVVFNNTSVKSCTLDVAAAAKTLTFTPDYSGNFNFGSSTLSVSGNVDFSTGGSVTAGAGALQFGGTFPQSFKPEVGQTFPAVIQNGSGGTTLVTNNLAASSLVISNGAMNLGAALTHTVGTVSAGGGSLDFGSSTLQTTGNVNLNGAAFGMNAGTGTLAFTGSGIQVFTPKTGATHPAITHTGAGTLDLAAALICGNLSQSAGALDFNGYNVTVNGNLAVTNGTTTTFLGLGNNLLITVGGVASFYGQAGNLLNMDGGTWRINMSTDGALSAMYARISYSTVTSAAPNGEATECVDGGATAGWTFITENYATWSHYKKIYINTTAGGAMVSGDIVNFPMLVRLNTNNIDFGQVVGAAGQDIRFAKSDGIHMDYQIEKWNDGVSAEVWVRVDTVYGDNKTQFFYMYWGRSGATDRSSGSKVFSTTNDFIGVYHLAENGNTAANGYLSATGSNNGTGSNMTAASDVAAVVGTGSGFNAGSSQCIATADAPFDLTDNFTLSTWVYTSDATDDWARVIDKIGRWTTGYGVGAKAGTYGFVAYWDGSGWGADPAGTFEPLNDATWHYITATVSGGVSQSYRDGQAISTFNGYGGQALTTNNYSLTFGKCASSNNYWTGTLDEIRIEKKPRSADWIKLCYETQRPGADVLFSPKTWDGGGADNNWSTAANWTDDAAPAPADDVLFAGMTSKDCSLDASVTVKSITFTEGYTGAFSFGASNTMTVTGNADFSSGGSVGEGSGCTLQFTGATAQLFVPKSGAAFPAIVQNGAGGTTISGNGLQGGALTITSGILHMGAGLSHSFTAINGAGGGLDFSGAMVQASGNVALSSVTCTAGSGTLVFAGSSNQTFTPSGGMPHITHTSANRLQLSAALNCLSFEQAAGSLNFNGYNVTTSGNFSVSPGCDTSFANIGGRLITVGGSAALAGQPGSLLNCNPETAWSINAAGNLSANYAAINRSTATQSNGRASSTCANGGVGVSGWTFDTENYATWTYNRNIYFNTTVTGANVSGDVSNFPMLIRLTGANFTFAQAMANGEDVRFATADQTPLPYQIESWNQAGQTAAVWVNVPEVYGNNKTQYVRLYWGKAGSVSRSGSTAAFPVAAGNTAIWHLNNGLNDATVNAITLTNVGSANAAALIADGRSFTGATNVNIPTSSIMNNLTAMTMSAWARTANSTINQTLFSFYYDADNYTYLRYDVTNGIVVKNWIGAMNNGWQVVTNYFPVDDAWFHVAWVMDGASWKVYINGELSAGAGQTMTMNNMPDNFYGSVAAERTGTASYGARWNGLIDEIRVSAAARDSAWIKLCYETQKPTASCVYISDAPIVTGPGGQGNITGAQYLADSVRITYEVGDPNNATVTISMQAKPSGGSWSNAGTTAGQIGAGISATSPVTDREIHWGVRAQLGSGIEGYYFARVIADDGVYRDTTVSDSFHVDTRAPAGLANFGQGSIAGTTVSLAWTPATDAQFGHYEIWYGTDPAKVNGRDDSSPGGAIKWDGADDAAMNSMTTRTTAIIALTTGTTYYFKIFAVDQWSNEATFPAISVFTPNRVEPVWSVTSLGDINGGAVTVDDIYTGSGANAFAIQKINLADGAKKWDYSTFPDSCRMPTYNFYNNYYQIVASAGDCIVGVRDDGGTNKTQLFPKRTIGTGAAPGNPYISTEDSYFYVIYTNYLDKRRMSDGLSAGAPWPRNLNNISKAADPVVFNDEVYVATTTGLVYKYSFNGVQSGPFNVGAGVYQPLVVVGGALYVAPATNKLFKIGTSTLDTAGGDGWVFTLTAANTGPVFVNGLDIYAACGNTIQKIHDYGAIASTVWISDVLSGTVTSGPIPYNGKVFAGRNGGEYHALSDSTGQAISSGWPYTGANGDSDTGPWIDQTRRNVLFSTTGGELRSFSTE